MLELNGGVWRDHFNCFLIPAESNLNTYCLINNALLYKGLLLFMYNQKIKKQDVAFCHIEIPVCEQIKRHNLLKLIKYRLASHCPPLFICKLNQINFKNIFLLCVCIYIYVLQITM